MRCIKAFHPESLGGVAVFALILAAVIPVAAAPAERTALYWCLDRPGSEQIQVGPKPGCEILHGEEEKKKALTDEEETSPRWTFSMGRIEESVSAFMERYRHFLACCMSDSDALNQIKDLEDEASALLRFSLTGFGERLGMFFRSNAGGLIVPVVESRNQLRDLKVTLMALERSRIRLAALDDETAGHERRRIEKVERSIEIDFTPPKRDERAATGPEIGSSGATRVAIQRSAVLVGVRIGTVPPTGMKIGTTPPTGAVIGRTPPSAEAFGFTPPTGPAIGSSSLNQRP